MSSCMTRPANSLDIQPRVIFVRIPDVEVENDVAHSSFKWPDLVLVVRRGFMKPCFQSPVRYRNNDPALAAGSPANKQKLPKC